MDNYIITIDGPAASGKSTIAKEVARILEIDYIDSGSMFRAVTLYMLDNNIDTDNKKDIVDSLENINIDFQENEIILNTKKVEKRIRENKINQEVSEIAKIKEVREFLLKKQRKIALNKSIVMDGRDIGSKVFPKAPYKFFLTATPEERARRRYEELLLRGEKNISYDQILKEIEKRDYIDSNRAVSPLVKPKNAIKIDTTEKNIESVVSYIVKFIEKDLSNDV